MSNNTPAVNQLPPAVILIFLPIIVMEGYLIGAEQGLWATRDARLLILRDYAVLPEVVDAMIGAGVWSWDLFIPFITHPFIHGTFLMAVFAGVIVLAIGKFVGEALGNMTVVLVFFGSAILGALVYLIVLPDTFPVFGAYPGAFGLIGAFSFMKFTQAGGIKDQQKRAFQLLGFLMVLTLVSTLIFGGPNTWVAEFTGAFSGFFIAAARTRGGINHIIAMARRR